MNVIYDSDTGETFCKECGVIQETQEMDSGPITAARGEETAPLSVYKLTMLNDKRVYRLAQVERNYVGGRRGRQVAVETDISRLCTRFNLPDHIEERVRQLMEKATRDRLIKGRTILACIAAAILLACREAGIPRTIKELHEATSVRTRTIFGAYGGLAKYAISKPTLPSEEIPQAIFVIAEKLGLSQKTAREALRLHEHVSSKDEFVIVGKRPTIYAAAILFLIAPVVEKKILTQRYVALLAETNEVSLRSRIRDISKTVDVSTWYLT